VKTALSATLARQPLRRVLTPAGAHERLSNRCQRGHARTWRASDHLKKCSRSTFREIPAPSCIDRAITLNGARIVRYIRYATRWPNPFEPHPALIWLRVAGYICAIANSLGIASSICSCSIGHARACPTLRRSRDCVGCTCMSLRFGAHRHEIGGIVWSVAYLLSHRHRIFEQVSTG